MSILAAGAAAGVVAWIFVVAVLLLSTGVSAIAIVAKAREAARAAIVGIFIFCLVSGGLCPSHLVQRDRFPNPLPHFT
jgi:hypothetical protein